VLQAAQFVTERSFIRADSSDLCLRSSFLGARTIPLLPAVLVLAGCDYGSTSANQTVRSFSIAIGASSIDTNSTGCNSNTQGGISAEQFTAVFAGGSTAPVIWSVSGEDAISGAGSINLTGQYIPPRAQR
jgi:hypothetical protein